MLTNDEELDPLVFDNLEVNSRTEVAHVDPTSSSLYCILRPDYHRFEMCELSWVENDRCKRRKRSHLSILLFSQER